MFAGEESGKGISDLLGGIKRYLELQKDYVLLELVEKLTILLSAILLIFVLVMLGMVAVFYLLFAAAYWLAPLVGGLTSSFAIIGLVVLVFILAIYLLRERLITKPITVFMAKLFFSSTKK